MILDGIAGPTTKVTASDSASVLADSIIKQGDFYAKAILITVETNNLRFAFSATPAIAGAGHTMNAGDNPPLYIVGRANVKNFKYINNVAATNCVFHVTAFF